MTPTLLMSSWISLQLCLITCRLSALRLTWPSSSSSSSSSPGRPEPGASAERKQPITATRSPQRPANAPQRSFRSFCPDQTSSPAVCSELRAPDPAPQSLSHTHTHSLQIMIRLLRLRIIIKIIHVSLSYFCRSTNNTI